MKDIIAHSFDRPLEKEMKSALVLALGLIGFLFPFSQGKSLDFGQMKKRFVDLKANLQKRVATLCPKNNCLFSKARCALKK